MLNLNSRTSMTTSTTDLFWVVEGGAARAVTKPSKHCMKKSDFLVERHRISSRRSVLFLLLCLAAFTQRSAFAESSSAWQSIVINPLSVEEPTFGVSLLRIVGGASEIAAVQESTIDSAEKMSSSDMDDIQVVFSDVDGTLVHYPPNIDSIKSSTGNAILKLPPSATGMQGIISSRTLVQCQELRRDGKKLVIVSGMRTSTLLKRLPYLPRADAYCSEAGGRIFFLLDDIPQGYSGVTVTPQPYDGAQQADLAPFGIEEDTEWRGRMERVGAAGSDGYVGAEFGIPGNPIPVADRKGLLWEFGRTLESKGFVLDTRGYSSCFRVNRKQQTTVSDEEFDALSSGQMDIPSGLSTSVNLGCVDFYPVESGKKNCIYGAHFSIISSDYGHSCKYLAQKFCNTQDDSVLLKHAVCLCDDDNDLEMALACQHSYVPGISSESMAKVIRDNPGRLTLTGKNVEGTAATEAALDLVLKRTSIDK